MRHLPFLLIYARIVIGVIVPLLIVFEFKSNSQLIVGLMVFGLLTDVFDGIIARKLGVSSEKLRVWDSGVDQFFWLSLIVSIFYKEKEIVSTLASPIILLVALEVLAYLISYLKFKKPIGTHSLLAKFWTLTLLAFLIELTLSSGASSFWLCFVFGFISRVEIILIILRLKKWVTDVPSLLVVGKINRGERVKKWKLFNS